MAKKTAETTEQTKQTTTVETPKAETKSAAIRRMAAEGMRTGDIAKALNIRFQFAYNVLKNAADKAEAEAQKNQA